MFVDIETATNNCDFVQFRDQIRGDIIWFDTITYIHIEPQKATKYDLTVPAQGAWAGARSLELGEAAVYHDHGGTVFLPAFLPLKAGFRCERFSYLVISLCGCE